MHDRRYSIPGMHCAHCVRAIEDALLRLPGVESVEVDLEAKHVTVTGPELDDAAVRAAIDDAGYDVAGVEV
ncbi:MAG: heavy-metal-associated domain-containing protein [Gaiella sp.]